MKNDVKQFQRLKNIEIIKGNDGIRIPIKAIKDLNVNFKDIEFTSNEEFEEELWDLKSLNNLYYTAVVDLNFSWWFICDSFHLVIDKKRVDDVEVESLQELENFTVLLEYVDYPEIEVYVPCDVNSYKSVNVNEDFIEITIREQK